nr:MAG TPA: hypothetical protein [Caudoviricetes sp.]
MPQKYSTEIYHFTFCFTRIRIMHSRIYERMRIYARCRFSNKH